MLASYILYVNILRWTFKVFSILYKNELLKFHKITKKVIIRDGNKRAVDA